MPSPGAGVHAGKEGRAERSGGGSYSTSNMEEILTWDSVSESWSGAGNKKTARVNRGATEVSLAVVADYCSLI